jgi:hypothetical protein
MRASICFFTPIFTIILGKIASSFQWEEGAPD